MEQATGISYAWASPPTAPAGTVVRREYQGLSTPVSFKTEADYLPHGLLSKGHCCWEEGVLTHLSIQCIWKMCWHLPNTAG
jgi:hypothetical protein